MTGALPPRGAALSKVSWAVAFAFVLMLGPATVSWVGPQQLEMDRELEEAKALYRSGKFTQALVKLQDLIGRLERSARVQTRSTPLLTEAHLYKGLSLIALDDPTSAKASFKAMLRRDPARQLDPQVYAPKIIALLEEARADLAAEAATGSPAEEPRPRGGSKTVPVVLGVGAVAAGVAVALGSGGSKPPTPAPATPTPSPTPAPTPSAPTSPPETRPQAALFVGSTPPPGSTITVGRDVLTVTIALFYNQPGIRRALVNMSTAANAFCATGSTSASFAGGQFGEVTVPLIVTSASTSPACALPLETVTLRACGATDQEPNVFYCPGQFAVTYRFVQ